MSAPNGYMTMSIERRDEEARELRESDLLIDDVGISKKADVQNSATANWYHVNGTPPISDHCTRRRTNTGTLNVH